MALWIKSRLAILGHGPDVAQFSSGEQVFFVICQNEQTSVGAAYMTICQSLVLLFRFGGGDAGERILFPGAAH